MYSYSGSLLSSLHSLHKYNINIIFEIFAKIDKNAVILNLTWFQIENKLKKKFFNLLLNQNQVRKFSHLPQNISTAKKQDKTYKPYIWQNFSPSQNPSS